MTPGRRRASHQAAVRSVLALSVAAVAAACNLLTGAGELTPCEGARCTNGELAVDGATAAVDGAGADAAGDHGDRGQAGPDGTSSGEMPPDSGDDDSGTTFPSSDGGTCSGTNGPCQVDSSCCSGLKCNTRGRCVSSCIAEGQDCVFGTCCLGARCSLIGGYACTACGLDGTSCNASAACCSNSCVNGSCVGNVSPGAM